MTGLTNGTGIKREACHVLIVMCVLILFVRENSEMWFVWERGGGGRGGQY